MDSDNARRSKARQLRYKKAIVKDLNYESITEKLYEISEECDDVRYYFEKMIKELPQQVWIQ